MTSGLQNSDTFSFENSEKDQSGSLIRGRKRDADIASQCAPLKEYLRSKIPNSTSASPQETKKVKFYDAENKFDGLVLLDNDFETVFTIW
jgi:hypothetical protein